MKKYFYLIFLAFALWTCVEPFEPEVGAYDSTLVVDGLFSNSEEPSVITLSRSFPYSEKVGFFIENATVVIEDDQGGRVQLAEAEPGVYQTDPAVFKGQNGRSYRLLINTPDGNQFESDWEEMKPAPPIDNLYFAVEEKIPDDPTLRPRPGAQVYISAKDAENNTRYYRWEYVETYQFGLRYPPILRVDYGSRPGNGEDEVVWLFGEEFEGGRCWKTERSTELIIATTENLTQDVVQDFPLRFVSNTTSRLYIRYSLLVKQYATSQAYYEFLRKIQEINQTTGSLFDPIPNEVFGNIRSSDGKDIPVLGYFGVAGVSERRLFINRADLPRGFGAPFGPTCLNDTIDLNFQTLFDKTKSGSLVVYDHLYNLFGSPIGFVMSQPPCTSCAASDATNEIPDFW